MKNEIQIHNDKYRCPKHGIIEDVVIVSVKGYEGYHCLVCYCEWLNKNIPRVEKIEEK